MDNSVLREEPPRDDLRLEDDHGQYPARDDHGQGPERDDHGPARDDHGQGPERDDHGPARDDHGQGPVRDDHGPARDDHGQGPERDDHGPVRDDHGQGPVRDDHGPVRDDHGQGPARDDHGQDPARDDCLLPEPDISEVYSWRDITEEFTAACKKLELGELLHDSSFGLFEAMSAIEMMDPKMDAGMICNQSKRKIVNFEQGVQDNLIKINTLSGEELIGVMDETLACMVTWLEGHSLAQTMFTNLYMHNPYVVEDRTLKAVTICLLKVIDLIRDRINRASVFEEEDFQPMTYGFKLACDVTDMRAMGMVKEVEDDLNRTIKNTRSKPGEERNQTTEREHDLAVAVHARLKFCRLFFSTLVAFTRDKCQGIEDAQKYLKQLSEILPSIKKSIHLGVTSICQGQGQSDYPSIVGFEPLVNQRLLPPTFPRYTQIKPRDVMIDYMSGLVNRLKQICQVCEQNGLHSVLEFLLEFSKPSPCVLSRSLLQLIYLPPSRRVFGSQNMREVLREAIRVFIAPPVLMPRSVLASNPQCKEYVDAFLAHAVRPMTQLIQNPGHNRARQRDKWGHLLEDLAFLQEGADKVDAFLHSLLGKVEPGRQHLACFGTWVLYHTLQVMIQYVLVGFELELYSVHEYHYVFWYLFECLYNWLISTLSRADSFLMDQETIAEQQQKGRSNKKNKKKKKPRPHSREVVMAQGAQNLCGGYYKALVGFTLDDKLRVPHFQYDDEEVRYNHRFAPFGCLVTPPPVQYTQFKDMTDLRRYDTPLDGADLYSGACKSFQQAKLHYESIVNPDEEVQTLLKISKTNFVVMKLLLGGHTKNSKAAPEFDFSQHRSFPVIKVT